MVHTVYCTAAGVKLLKMVSPRARRRAPHSKYESLPASHSKIRMLSFCLYLSLSLHLDVLMCNISTGLMTYSEFEVKKLSFFHIPSRSFCIRHKCG